MQTWFDEEKVWLRENLPDVEATYSLAIKEITSFRDFYSTMNYYHHTSVIIAWHLKDC